MNRSVAAKLEQKLITQELQVEDSDIPSQREDSFHIDTNRRGIGSEQ